MRRIGRVIIVLAVLTGSTGLAGCGSGADSGGGADQGSNGSAALRGFGVAVDQAVSGRLSTVHLSTCGRWGCHEQDVPLHVSGPTSAGPCPTAGSPDSACSVVQLPGPGPGYGYAPVPPLTMDPVTVTVTTPPGAQLVIRASVEVLPRAVCSGGRATCADGTPQAQLRIAADGSVSQSR